MIKKDVWIAAPCFAKASQGQGYDMEGLWKCGKGPREITFHYLTGQAKK